MKEEERVISSELPGDRNTPRRNSQDLESQSARYGLIMSCQLEKEKSEEG